MNTHELLIRTMNAAKDAREKGFDNTADALDGIVERLLEFINSQAQPGGEKRANSPADVQHLH